jgi:outer membrane autotransporter protein
MAAVAAPHSALAACSGENTANVTCDAANPATAGTLNTSFPGTTLVTVNPGAGITGQATATVTAPGALTFNHNDPAGMSTAALFNDFGAVTFTGNGPLNGFGIFASAGSSGNISITANSPVFGSGTGIQVLNSGTGTSLVTGSGSIQGFFASAILVTATGNGPGAGVDGIRISGTGDVSTVKNPAIGARITNPANNSNIVIDRSGAIGGGGSGINATTAGGGNITVTISNFVSASVGTGVGLEAVNGTNTVNVTAGKVLGGFTGIFAGVSGPGASNIAISSGAEVNSFSGTGVLLSGGTNTIVNNGTISASIGVLTISGTTAVDNAGSISGSDGTGVRLGGANNLFIMDGPLASLTGLALGSGSDTFRLGGSGSNTFDVSQIGTGWTSFEKSGSSVWTLTGIATYAGPASVNAGTLLVNGSLASSSGLTVNPGATVGGTGTLPKTTINGGTLSPGNAIGTIAISGSLTFIGPGTYLVEVSPAVADRTNVSGSAALGGTVQVNAVSGLYSPKHYTILNAGSISGTFGSLAVNGSFGPAVRNPHLEYDANNVYFVLDPNAISPFLGGGGTRNERAVAAAIDTAFQAGIAAPPFLALFGLTSAQLAGALDQLSGEVHPSTAGLLLDESHYARSAVLGRLRQASYGGDTRMVSLAAGGPSAFRDGEEQTSALAYGKSPLPVKAPPFAGAPSRDVTFWAQGFGAWGRFDGDANAASVRRNLAGFFTGVDAPFGAGRAGFAAGYTGSRNNLDGRGSANVETTHLAAYGGWRFGALSLRGGAAYAWHAIDTDRTIVFPGFFDRPISHYEGHTGQIFGEFGYGVAFGGVAIEPFAGAAWVDLRTGPAVERGGVEALNVAATSFEVGYSTLGIRAATMIPLARDMVLVTRASLAWQHALTDVVPTATLAFQAAPAPFVIAGVPIARDTALAEAGLDLAIGRHATVGISYTGQLANNVQDHAAKGKFSWKF